MRKNVVATKSFLGFFFLIVTLLLSACGGGRLEGDEVIVNTEPEPELKEFTSGVYSGKVKIDITADPELRVTNKQSTEIILQFIPRNKDNLPLSSEHVKVTMLVDDSQITDESHIESSEEQLAFNVNFGLVLDSSYSMLVSHGDNEAFTPMLNSAKDAVQKGIDIWSGQKGNFSFHTTWFSTSIYSSIDTTNHQWTPNDLTFIPRPKSGDFTRLFAATDYAVEKMSLDTPEDQMGPRDQNIILVFSDGVDTYSYSTLDKDTAPLHLNTDNNAEYLKLGRDTTTLEDLVSRINSKNKLSVHVIGMGNNINITDLQAIATAGNGLYLQNPNADEIDKPFQRIIQEFTTLQTHGADIPLADGEYKFTLHVENAAGTDFADYTFSFKTLEGVAEIIP